MNPDNLQEGYPDLTAQQQLILAAVLSSPTRTEAAKRLEMHRTTLYRYLRQPELAQAIKECEEADYRVTASSLLAAGELGVSVLEELARGGKGIPAYVRGVSARALVELALKTNEDLSLREELDKLKAEMAEAGIPV